MLDVLASIIVTSLLFSSSFAFFTVRSSDVMVLPRAVETPGLTRINHMSAGIKTTAKSVVVIDDQSGQVLYDKNGGTVFPVASITKLMTALVLLDTRPDWTKIIAITKEDERQGNIVYALPGDEITTKDLFTLMLTASANEAAVTLARSTGITDFVGAMNKKARDLGMSNTHFVDPSGLDPANVSSARDLITLSRAAFAAADIVTAVKSQDFDFTVANTKRHVHAATTDRLLSGFLNNQPYSIIAAKTGHLDEAGYCLMIQIKRDDGPSVTLVSLGANTALDRWQEAKGVIDWVFRNYQWSK